MMCHGSRGPPAEVGRGVKVRRGSTAIAGWFTRLDPPPDVFAVVMATGIVSVAARDHGYRYLEVGLGLVAVATFAVLGLGFVIRAATHLSRVMRLTRDPDVALRMFTFVAACTVLGDLLRGRLVAAGALDGLALAGWIVLVPLALVDVHSRRAAQLRDQSHGAWLLPSVATSGLAGAAARWAVQARSPLLLIVAAAAVLLALAIYVAMGSLIVWRAVSAPFDPREVPPDSWILMGALAICALASSHVLAALRALGEPPLLVYPGRLLMIGVWVAASLWVPVLLYAQMWRSDHMVGTLHYQGVWWSAVFPIGMYSATSWAVGTELGTTRLATVSLMFFWIAMTIWALVATGLLHVGLKRALRLRRGAEGAELPRPTTTSRPAS